MSTLSDRLRDLVPHVRGTGLDGRGHVLVREAAAALDAMESALRAAEPFVAHFKGGWSSHTPGTISTATLLAAIRGALAKLEGK